MCTGPNEITQSSVNFLSITTSLELIYGMDKKLLEFTGFHCQLKRVGKLRIQKGHFSDFDMISYENFETFLKQKLYMEF
jgi:hypothetical protein